MIRNYEHNRQSADIDFMHKVEFEIFKQIFSENQVDKCEFPRYIYESKK